MEMRNHGLAAFLPCNFYLDLKLKILSIQGPSTTTDTMFTNLLYLCVIWKLSATSSDLLSVFEDLGERTRYIAITI